MRFSFEVGEQEKHHVEFSWSSFLGVAKIWVDGYLVQKSCPLALRDLAQLSGLRTVSGSAGYFAGMIDGSGRPELTMAWAFEVGQREHHRIRIEKERPLILPAFRSNKYRIFVNDEFLKELVG
jgi:hypothetical protein